MISMQLTENQQNQYNALLDSQGVEVATKYKKMLLNPTYLDTKDGVINFDFEEAISEAIACLKKTGAITKKNRHTDRRVLLWMQDKEIHRTGKKKFPSFGQLLDHHFGITEGRNYRKELVVATKERLLGIPIGTYSTWEFKPLEKFRAVVSNGQSGNGGEKFRKGAATFGNKIDQEQVRRLMECWKKACELSGNSLPAREHIVKASREIGKKYGLKDTECKNVAYWKKRAIALENKLKELGIEID